MNAVQWPSIPDLCAPDPQMTGASWSVPLLVGVPLGALSLEFQTVHQLRDVRVDVWVQRLSV